MATALYKSIKKADAIITEVGFHKAWVSLLSDFTTLASPTIGTTPALGEKFTISGAHAWTVGKEPIALYMQIESIEAPGESQGEKGFLSLTWKPKGFIQGDGPKILEIVNNLSNEDVVVFVQNECDTEAKIIQFGCDCSPAKISKITPQSGNKAGGKVGYELEFMSYCKYFYTGGVITTRS